MTTNTKPGARFMTWLARAAIESREGSGTRLEDIASRARAGIDQIRRFEAAKSTPREIDRVIAAYAEFAGIADPREIYGRALELWYEHGQAPLARDEPSGDGLTPGQRFEQAMQPRRAPKAAPRERARTTSATPKRRAGG